MTKQWAPFNYIYKGARTLIWKQICIVQEVVEI